jgi:hypothetical protein
LEEEGGVEVGIEETKIGEDAKVVVEEEELEISKSFSSIT